MARRSEKNFNISLAESLSFKERDNGKSDPEGVFPRVEYEEASSVNNVARGTKRVNVELGGATANLNLDLKKEPVRSYPTVR